MNARLPLLSRICNYDRGGGWVAGTVESRKDLSKVQGWQEETRRAVGGLESKSKNQGQLPAPRSLSLLLSLSLSLLRNAGRSRVSSIW